MKTEVAKAAIEKFIELKKQADEVNKLIEASKHGFYSACDAYSENGDVIEINDVVLRKSAVAGKWTYGAEILILEAKLKGMKKEYQLLNESNNSGEKIWKVELN